jgi:hypothetical protein
VNPTDPSSVSLSSRRLLPNSFTGADAREAFEAATPAIARFMADRFGYSATIEIAAVRCRNRGQRSPELRYLRIGETIRKKKLTGRKP